MRLLEPMLPHTSNYELDSGHPAVSAGSPTVEQAESAVPFITVSPVMLTVRQRAELLATVDTPVLITGESGTGKQSVARLIHELSSRAGFRFVRVDCIGVSSTALEQELFGGQPQSRNGSLRAWPGKIEMSQHGSLFVSDIAEMPLQVQAGLHRALKQRQFFPASATAPTDLDVRLLAATSLDVKRELEEGHLRRDLYYYINAFLLHVPPLRERREDIPQLVEHFVERLAKQFKLAPRGFSSATLQALQAYSWPGNLLELENLVKWHLVVDDEASLQRNMQQRLADSYFTHASSSSLHGAAASGLKSVIRAVRETTEKDIIGGALSQTHWNRKAAARLLKISYRALLYKIAHFQLTPPTHRDQIK
jgi:two-component system, NtrC family, response regulator AtoC